MVEVAILARSSPPFEGEARSIPLFLAQPRIAALDVRVLGRLARFDELQAYAMVTGPPIQNPPAKFRTVLPREAVMDTGVRKVVFVQKDEGTFEPRVIETGWETDEGYEVKSGLKAGERIVVSGNFLLDSESRVQAGLEDSGDSHGQ